MEETIASSKSTDARPAPSSRFVLLSVILLVLISGFFGYRALTGRQQVSTQTTAGLISVTEFEERYGLRVRLIGVTAGGGMIDFRLKILDVEKARKFLQDPANLPRLTVAESGEALMGTEGLDDDISWEEGGILFILFSNTDGVIKAGTPVIVEFGSVQLEPILAQ